MRIVLSRKGYDSANGGMPSPVFVSSDENWNYRMYSLPIPEFRRNSDGSIISFNTGAKRSDLRYPRDFDVKVSYPKGLDSDFFVHHDPDIRRYTHRRIPENWVPVYGQTEGAATHLRGEHDEHLGTDTLFIYFGLFQFVARNAEGSWVRMPGTEPFHAIWGYLQAKKVVCMDISKRKCSEAVARYSWHPHCSEHKLQSRKNTLYIGSESPLTFDGRVMDVPSYGTFKYSRELALTADRMSSSRWSLDSLPWLDLDNRLPHMTHHDGKSFGNGFFQSAMIGQEFIVDEDAATCEKVFSWLENLLRNRETRDWEGILE